MKYICVVYLKLSCIRRQQIDIGSFAAPLTQNQAKHITTISVGWNNNK